jgi:putative copper resistance protein D
MEQTGLVAARLAVWLCLLPAAGLPLYWLTASFPATRRVGAAGAGTRWAAAILALLAGLASAWWLLASVAAMADLPLTGLDRETVSAVADATPLGLVLKVRLAALAVLALAMVLRLPLVLPALAGLVALASAAFTGHAGATEGLAGMGHRLSDTVHLAAAACWIGALWTFLAGAIAGRDHASLELRLARFAAAGTAIVALLTVTGIANVLLITGWPMPILSRWSLVLALKLVLFGAMLALAALNRWRLTPALAAGRPGAARALRRSLAAETLCALGVLALVALLGTLDPSA